MVTVEDLFFGDESYELVIRARQLEAVASAARDYLDYLAESKLKPYGGELRRQRLRSELRRLDQLKDDA